MKEKYLDGNMSIMKRNEKFVTEAENKNTFDVSKWRKIVIFNY